jgi:tetratricopeptide (TPR) repeat protein
MKYFSIYIFFILFYSSMHAQTVKIDSLKTALMHASHDTARLRMMYFIAQDYMRAGIYDSQFVYAEKALSLHITNPNAEQKKYQAGSLRMKGIYFRTKGNYEKAIQYYIQALKQYEVLQDTLGIASTHTSIGIAYLALERYDEAYVSFSKAYMLDSIKQNTNNEIINLTNMTYALHGNGSSPEWKLQQALAHSNKALELSKKTDNKQLWVSANESVALSLFHMSRYHEALVYQKEALALAEEITSIPVIAEQHYLLAQLYYYLGNLTKAEEHGLISEKLSQEHSLYTYYRHTYGILTDVYEKKGEWQKAFTYAKLLNAIIDSTYKTEIAEQLKMYETERKDQEIALLNSDNDLLRARDTVRTALLQRNRGFLIASIVCAALLGILLILVYRNRQAKIQNIRELEKLNTLLQEQKTEITGMNSILELKALRSQMNPHFIFNCMSSIQECMLAYRLDDANTYLTKLSKLLRMVLEYANEENITLDKELEMLELYLKLESVRLKNNFDYTIQISNDVFAEEILVPTLILQPIAENAIWHGLQNKPDNRQLKIQIHTSEQMLLCIIEDNGIGIQNAHALPRKLKNHSSRGLQLIKKRLEILKQKVNHHATGIKFYDLAESGTNTSGTRVEILLPLYS